MSATATRHHIYRGHDIYPCERIAGEHAGRWTIQTYHHTGVPWADEECPHFGSLAEARDYIAQAIAEEAQR